ncbi:glycosyltransferase [Frondihabitans australicus]|uniref:Cellulose synthase/poly-beta-1,6-N-acetylglucosamine synthase-like glycosyltransferase n=1 Tax=Frondihabitans australicus TaxID=386892 RepID=A0A495ID42_9MICO|nr:glycosyltransferase [Frondihabitans australicus]RKR73550.1 cellulose synthase/poly-beta-1,6-N-acetylglucosamine synthase-like glycosyltransferase [Frondihabitans australicus]
MSRLRSSAVVVGLVASVAAGHVVYPALLGLAARFRSREPVRPIISEWPPITVVVPAYREKGVIALKVDNIRDNGYPGDVRILVVADGDAETAEIAREAGADILLLDQRGGKSAALNAGVAHAETEWIVCTDANAQLVGGSLQNLVAWLSDSSIGAVAGEKLEGDGGELAYWRFTSWIKRNEWRTGSTIALDGGLCAVRKSAWQPIPVGISCDDFWISLDMNDRGHRVAYEPDAAVREESIGSFALSWERRTRVMASSFFVLAQKRRMLSPMTGAISAKIWGHKVWRSTLGPLSHVALIGLAVARAPRNPLAGAFLAFNAVAAIAVVAEARGRDLPRPAGIVAQVAYLQAVALAGMVRFVAGDRAVTWKKPDR